MVANIGSASDSLVRAGWGRAHPGTRMSAHPGARLRGPPGARLSGHPGARMSGHPGARMSGPPIHKYCKEAHLLPYTAA